MALYEVFSLPALARIADPRFPLTVARPYRPTRIKGLERMAVSSPLIRRLAPLYYCSGRLARTEIVPFWAQPKTRRT